MPLKPTYFLADIDGVIHVAERVTDWEQPRYVVAYYPTHFTTRDMCGELEIPAGELRRRLTIKQNMPGEYAIALRDGNVHVGWPRAIGLKLGGKTVSAHTAFEPVPTPRVGKGTKLEWANGRWNKCSPKGKWTAIEV